MRVSDDVCAYMLACTHVMCIMYTYTAWVRAGMMPSCNRNLVTAYTRVYVHACINARTHTRTQAGHGTYWAAAGQSAGVAARSATAPASRSSGGGGGGGVAVAAGEESVLL